MKYYDLIFCNLIFFDESFTHTEHIFDFFHFFFCCWFNYNYTYMHISRNFPPNTFDFTCYFIHLYNEQKCDLMFISDLKCDLINSFVIPNS